MALKHVVVGGGTGFIGTRLVDRLGHEGSKCTIISRMPGHKRMTWHDVEKHGLPEDTSAVINVSGQNVLDPTRTWTIGFKQNVRSSRVQTTKLLANAVANSKAKVFATISGVAYYKPNSTSYTEESKCEPYDFFSELCHDWEAAAQIPKDRNIRQVTVRSGVVLGKTGGMIKNIYWPFFFGLGGPLGSGDQYMPWIHINDLTNLFVFALKNENVNGILNGVAPQVITNNEFTKAFASAMRRPAFMITPAFVLKIIFNEERAAMILKGQKVVPKRVMELGFQYDYPDIKKASKQLVE